MQVLGDNVFIQPLHVELLLGIRFGTKQSKGNVPALLDLEGIGEELSKREWLKVEGVAL